MTKRMNNQRTFDDTCLVDLLMTYSGILETDDKKYEITFDDRGLAG